MGVGGDVGWEPCVYEQYRVRANREFLYSVSFICISPGDEPAVVAKRHATK